MILPDYEIRRYINSGYIGCSPEPEDSQYQPATLDVRLGETFIIDDREYTVPEGKKLTVGPGEFMLGTTLEYLSIPDDILAELTGKSTYAREGLTVHITAGLIDPGFQGTITLEIKNVSNKPVHLTVGEPIGQVKFAEMWGPAERPYNEHDNHYQYQDGATRSRRDR